MITINVINNTIFGSCEGKPFGRTFNKDVYTKMAELVELYDNAQTIEEQKTIASQFQELTIEDLSGTIEGINPYIHVSRKTGEFFLQNNGVTSSVPMPSALVDRIKESMDKGVDFMPLIKFWVNFLKNPKLRRLSKEGQVSFSKRVFNYINIKYTNQEYISELMKDKGYSREVATDLATTYQVKITNEGLLSTFKVSREITQEWQLDEDGNRIQVPMYPTTKTIDKISGLITESEPDKGNNENRWFKPAVQGDGGDAFYCSTLQKPGHVIKVGATHSITWDQIDTDDNRSCVKGLHVGNMDYIRSYQNDGTCTHNIFVNPMHIGAVPDDSTGAIRCVQYFVKDELSGINGALYNSSTYAAQTEKEFAASRAEVIAAFNKQQSDKAAEINAEITELNSLS